MVKEGEFFMGDTMKNLAKSLIVLFVLSFLYACSDLGPAEDIPEGPICGAGEMLVDGSCSIVPPACGDDEELVGRECLPRCGDDEERVDGACVPSCADDEERVDGSCRPIQVQMEDHPREDSSEEDRSTNDRVDDPAVETPPPGACSPTCEVNEECVDGVCRQKSGQENPPDNNPPAGSGTSSIEANITKAIWTEGNVEDPFILELQNGAIIMSEGEGLALVVKNGNGDYSCEIDGEHFTPEDFVLRNEIVREGKTYPKIVKPSKKYNINDVAINIVEFNTAKDDDIYACAILFKSSLPAKEFNDSCWTNNTCGQQVIDKIKFVVRKGAEIKLLEVLDLKILPQKNVTTHEFACDDDYSPLMLEVVNQTEDAPSIVKELNVKFLPVSDGDRLYFIDSSEPMKVKRNTEYKATLKVWGGKGNYSWSWSCPKKLEKSCFVETASSAQGSNDMLHIKIIFPAEISEDVIDGFNIQVTDGCNPKRTIRRTADFIVSDCRIKKIGKNETINIYPLYGGMEGSDRFKSIKISENESFVLHTYRFMWGLDFSPMYEMDIKEGSCLEDYDRMHFQFMSSRPSDSDRVTSCIFSEEKWSITLKKLVVVSCEDENEGLFVNGVPNSCFFATWKGNVKETVDICDWSTPMPNDMNFYLDFESCNDHGDLWCGSYPFRELPTKWPGKPFGPDQVTTRRETLP
jgi:hypothetical protein